MRKDNKNLAMKLVNLSKTYQLHHEKPTLMENIFGKNDRELFTALKGINLEIKKGEKICIIGPNGSGKTTLLKIIAGISTPTKGTVQTWGKLVSLIDLGAGFHPELTGQENIFLNALLVGMGREEVLLKYQDIVDFADIGKFINAPMYTYSEGMKLRLGFAIAVAANPDTLILDESFAVGDEKFKKKSSDKIEEFFKQKKTIILVSHWMEYLQEHCQKAIWIDKGKIVMNGEIKKVVKEYLKVMLKSNK